MKRLDRLKQWAGERMGGEVKTTQSDEFKSMETEMGLRHEGMEKLHNSMSIYLKSLSKRTEAEDKEKMLPIDVLAQAMISHGEEFEPDSVYGNCLIKTGQANEKIARVQDSYVTATSETWLEALERSLAQMKEYQAARKRLDSRRLAYDATLTKLQKQKREDFRVEEELRAQRIKYEEANEDVCRRMADIQEAEGEAVLNLTAFMEAELEYHERCRDILLQVKRQWPAGQDFSRNSHMHRASSRQNSLPPKEEALPPQPERHRIGSRITSASNVNEENHRSRVSSFNDRNKIPTPEPTDYPLRSTYQRTNSLSGSLSSFEGPTTAARRGQVVEPPPLPANRSRDSFRTQTNTDVSNERRNNQRSVTSSPDRHQSRDVSPTNSTPLHKLPSRTPSNTNLSSAYAHAGSARKPVAPPPPAPRSAVKKPPPPPPAKKSALQSSANT